MDWLYRIGCLYYLYSNDGSVDFYGLTFHGLNTTYDNFALNPAGFTINGANFTFDIGSAVGLEGCSGLYIHTGTCSTIWNNLGLDGGVRAVNGAYGPYTNSRFAKYASTHLDSSQLTVLGITGGNNSVTFTTWSNNVDWAAEPFTSSTVPINLVVAQVPEPETMLLFGLAMAGLGFARRKRNS